VTQPSIAGSASGKTTDKTPEMPPPAPLGMVQSTIFLIADIPGEVEPALAYIARQYPGSVAHKTNELHLASLREDNVVIPLSRKGLSMSVVFKGDDGGLGTMSRALEELTDDVVECDPVPVAPFWVKHGDTSSMSYGWRLDGSLDSAPFMNALSKSTLARGRIQRVVKRVDVASRKNGEEAERVVLRDV
jgi:hypothetical protein